MIEFLRHLFGVCGEGHPTLMTMLLPIGAFILNMYVAIKFGVLNFLGIFRKRNNENKTKL